MSGIWRLLNTDLTCFPHINSWWDLWNSKSRATCYVHKNYKRPWVLKASTFPQHSLPSRLNWSKTIRCLMLPSSLPVPETITCPQWLTCTSMSCVLLYHRLIALPMPTAETNRCCMDLVVLCMGQLGGSSRPWSVRCFSDEQFYLHKISRLGYDWMTWATLVLSPQYDLFLLVSGSSLREDSLSSAPLPHPGLSAF